MYGIRISDIPIRITERDLKIHFKDPKNGGGPIKTVYYPLHYNDAVILFEDESVVNRILAAHDNADSFCVRKLPEMVYTLVEAEVDPTFSAMLSAESEKYIDILKFDGDVEVLPMKDGCIKLKGSWFQLEWAWRLMEEIQARQLEIHTNIQRSLSTGSQTGDSLFPMENVGRQPDVDMRFEQSSLDVNSNGRLSPLGGGEQLNGIQSGICTGLDQVYNSIGSLNGSFVSPFNRMDSNISDYDVSDSRKTASASHSPSHKSRAVRQTDADETFRIMAGSNSIKDVNTTDIQPLSARSTSTLDVNVKINDGNERDQNKVNRKLNIQNSNDRDRIDSSYLRQELITLDSNLRNPVTHYNSPSYHNDHTRGTIIGDLPIQGANSNSPLLDEQSMSIKEGHSLVSKHLRSPEKELMGKGTDHSNEFSRFVNTSQNDTLWSAQIDPSNLSYSFNLPGKIRVTICVGDITEEKSEVIVNAANSTLMHFGGVAKAIATAADAKMQHECDAYIAKHGTLRTGEVLKTTAGGRLRGSVAHIFHVVGPMYIKGITDNCESDLVETFLHCLEEAEKAWVPNISFPMISAGVFGVPLDVCMQSFMDALVLFAKANPIHLKEIRMVNNLTDAVCSGIIMIQQIWEQGYERTFQEAEKRWEKKQLSSFSYRSSDLSNPSATWHGTDRALHSYHGTLGEDRSSEYSQGERHRNHNKLSKHDVQSRYTSEKNKEPVKPIARKIRSSSTSRLPAKKSGESDNERYSNTDAHFNHDMKSAFRNVHSERDSYDDRSSYHSLGGNYGSHRDKYSSLDAQRNSKSNSHVKSSSSDLRSSKVSAAAQSSSSLSSQSARKRSNSFNLSRDFPDKGNGTDKAFKRTVENSKTSSSSSSANKKMPQMKGTLATRSTSKVKSTTSVTSPVSSSRQPMKAGTTVTTSDRGRKASAFSPDSSPREMKSHSQSTYQEYENNQFRPRVNFEDNLEDEDCVICMEKMVNPKTLSKCKHRFCSSCIKQHFEKCRPSCPQCGVLYGIVKGNQPDGGKMSHYVDQFLKIPGYESCKGAIVISYDIPGGVQTDEHPATGRKYFGIYRTAYLPNNREGNEILRLLRKAFDLRLIFTIGDSRTTGAAGVITWNDIHHKTNIDGGPTKFGYPDPTYLQRVREELAAKGVVSEGK